jgi:hypothetical protein
MGWQAPAGARKLTAAGTARTRPRSLPWLGRRICTGHRLAAQSARSYLGESDDLTKYLGHRNLLRSIK